MRAANVTWRGIDISDVKEMDFTEAEQKTYELRGGDILLAEASGSASEVGKPAVWREEVPNACFQNTLIRVRAADERHVPYLYWHFMYDALNGRFAALSRGTGIHHIGAKNLEDWRVSLAPVSIVERIVAAIEAHFSRIDATVASLERAKANVKRARASVLKAAVEGRLVPTEAELARAEGRDYEHASVLLERIVGERAARRELEGKKKSRTKVPLQVAPARNGIPDGWVMTTLGHAFDVEVGATPSRDRPEYWCGTVPWVSSGEVQFCRIRATEETITEAGLRNTSTKLHPAGTVLIGMIGQGRTRGQVAILDIEACNNQNCAAIRVSEAGCVPEYVYGWLELQYQETRRLGSGNNQQALNKTRVEAIPIPLPPVAEQYRIVAEVERRLSVLDALNATIDANLARCARLRQSILKRAFEGRLVPPETGTRKSRNSTLEQLDLLFAQGSAE